MKILKNMWKFTDTDKDISDSNAYKCLELAESGNMKEFKKAYKELSKGSFGADYLMTGRYRLLGYELNFTPYLKRFLVKFRYDSYYTVRYALNKTNLYDNMYVNRYDVVDIVEDTRHKVVV